MARAELSDPQRLEELLSAPVPAGWPPGQMHDALPWFVAQLTAHPEKCGWLVWYGVLRGDGRVARALAVSVGFRGPPGPDGRVEIGYSVMPELRGHGLATEAAACLVEWAFGTPEVRAVVAHVSPDNPASRAVLHKLGFRPTGATDDEGNLRYRLARRG